jgi:uncharacterized protein (DUF885 family)
LLLPSKFVTRLIPYSSGRLLTIVRGREKTLGTKFNIRAFHDAVLELGSVPLPIVTARIDRFISEGGKGPYPAMA